MKLYQMVMMAILHHFGILGYPPFSSGMAGWKIHHLYDFPIDTSIFIRDVQACHV
jgi:hypothetical protein